MTSPSVASLRRRITVATGAGALVLLGGAGVAYAAGSVDDSPETGWSTVVDADPAASGATAPSADSASRGTQDCPDDAGPSQNDPGQGIPGPGIPSQDGEL
jgi:hypothetical protein